MTESFKVKYSHLPFKTDRNFIVKFDPNTGVNMKRKPKKSNVTINSIKLPNKVYHVSPTPISSFKENRIFYVSFDKFQSIAHGLSVMKDDITPFTKKKLYFYTLKPKNKNARVVMFDKKKRPKGVSNVVGAKYNTLTNNAMMKLGLIGPQFLNEKDIIKSEFKEGSGDNMILGQILCDTLKGVEGIRNSFDQDELAICNPRNFFDISDRRIIHLKDLINARNCVYDIKFNRKDPNGMQYKLNEKYTKNMVINFLNKKSKVNVSPLLNKITRN